MTAKQDRRARKKGHRLMIRCDRCWRRQRFHRGHGHPSGCTGCGHIYGTYDMESMP